MKQNVTSCSTFFDIYSNEKSARTTYLMFYFINFTDCCQYVIIHYLMLNTNFKLGQDWDKTGKVVECSKNTGFRTFHSQTGSLVTCAMIRYERDILESYNCLQAKMEHGSPLCETHDYIRENMDSGRLC